MVESKITNRSKPKEKMHMNCGSYPVQANTVFFRRKKERKGEMRKGFFPCRI